MANRRSLKERIEAHERKAAEYHVKAEKYRRMCEEQTLKAERLRYEAQAAAGVPVAAA